MGAVGQLAWCGLRRRWRGVVVVALLVGVVGAVVLAMVAGARRSESALARFDATSRSSDVALSPAFGYSVTPAQLAAVRHLKNVEAVATLRFYVLMAVHAPATLTGAAAVDSAMGRAVDRFRVVAGRRANPDVPDEITVSERLAAQLHLRVGGHLEFRSYTPAQVAAMPGGGRPPPPAGPRIRLRIVGVVRRPGDLGDVGSGGELVVLTPAFDRASLNRAGNYGEYLLVRTRHGASDVPKVFAAARPIFEASGGLSSEPGLDDTRGAQDAISVLTFALWLFAGVAALAGVVAVGIVLSREASVGNVDQATLRALGVTRMQRMLVSAPATVLIWAGGAFVAVLGAVAMSTLFPFGIAGRAEPDPGFHVDGLVIAVGVIAIGIVVVVVAVISAWRSTQPAASDARARAWRSSSRIAEAASRAGFAPPVTSGLRMAFEPGRGSTAVPVRSAQLGAVFAMLGITAILIFTADLSALAATPRRFGAPWDFSVVDNRTNTSMPGACGTQDFGLNKVVGVGAVAALCANDVQVGGRPVTGWGFTGIRGAIGPVIVAGRAPHGPNEVALGALTLREMGKRVGEHVTGRGPRRTVDFRIVGRAIFPELGQSRSLANGAAFTGTGIARIFDTNTSSQRFLLGRFSAGVDRAVVGDRIARIQAFGRPTAPAVPVEIDRIRHVGWLAGALAAVIGVLALGALGHALITGVRRRRRDLALLKTFGFSRRQVRTTIAWQAMTLTLVGVAIGIPAGVIVGRIAWQRVAQDLGTATTTLIPDLAILAVIPAALIAVNAVAYLPARRAARTSPGVALRSE